MTKALPKNWSNTLVIVAIIALIAANIWYVLATKTSDQQMGEEAPGFSLPVINTASGDLEEVSLKSLQGKVVVMDFWATWCPSCVKSLPELEAFYLSIDPDKVAVYAVNGEGRGVTFERARTLAGRFLKQRKFTFPSMIDNGSVFGAYGITGIPQTVIIDTEGKIRYVHQGGISKEELEREVSKYLP